jgi:hypothetical protein
VSTTIPASQTPTPEPTVTTTTSPTVSVSLSLPPFAALTSDWTRLYPGEPTICAHGTDYSFWARQGTSDNLLIYFEPGGGCWDAASCASGSGFYDDTVEQSSSPQGQSGIFDLNNPDNPFSDYDMVYIPVCTGDVHWGSYTQTYTASDGSTLTIHHNGFVNASTVLAWVYANIDQPASIFVTGCSAGSPGSIFHAPYIIEHYPAVPITQLGDSLAFVYHRPLNMQVDYHAHDNFPSWIPALGDILPGEFTMARFYSAVAAYYPDHRFGQVNTQSDSVQQFFYESIGGDRANWITDFEASLNEIHASAPNFYTFTLGGQQHCILPRPDFYTAAAQGVRFRDWLAEYVNRQPIESIHCENCSQPEIVR